MVRKRLATPSPTALVQSGVPGCLASDPFGSVLERRDQLVAALARAVPEMQNRAPRLDRGGDFPVIDLNLLRELGALAAPAPVALGGLGLGTEPEGALDLMEVLRLIGRGNLSVGRIYEAHVNAMRLIVRYGSEAQALRAANDAREGHLFGLWVTDAPDAPVRLTGNFLLRGSKCPCSGPWPG